MKIKKSTIIKFLLLVVLVPLIIFLISCSNVEQKDIDKGSSTETENTGLSDLEQADENLETEESDVQQSNPESEDSAVSELCYNPYIPLKPGVVWTYETQLYGQGEATQYTVNQKKVDSETFIVTQSFPGYISEVTWKCTGNGIIQNEYTGFDTQNMSEGMEFNTIEFKGVTYPPADEWKTGTTWNMDYTISAKADTESGELTYEGHVIIDNEIAAMESVEVPAGIYEDTLRVDTILKVDLVYEIQGISQDVNIDLEMSTWYAKDVGWVKQVSGPESASSTTVLLSME